MLTMTFEDALVDALTEMSNGVFVMWGNQQASRDGFTYPYIELNWSSYDVSNPLDVYPLQPTKRGNVPFNATRWPQGELAVPSDVGYQFDTSKFGVLSVTVRHEATSRNVAQDIASTVRRFFEANYTFFELNDATCYDPSPVQNRTSLLEAEVEVKLGFDVRIERGDSFDLIERSMERIGAGIRFDIDREGNVHSAEIIDTKSSDYPS